MPPAALAPLAKAKEAEGDGLLEATEKEIYEMNKDWG